MTSEMTYEESSELHTLSDKWVLWAHLPHDTNWSINSYIQVSTIHSIEEMVELIQSLKESLVKNCMLFLMKEGIKPMWEDPKNVNGGCFSMKINNKVVNNTWKNICYTTLGNSISNDSDFLKTINGITISPKKTFCIIKIWTSTCDYTTTNVFDSNLDFLDDGILFKKHSK